MNVGVINQPKNPGATMRVWEIADELTRHAGSMAGRKDVIEAYVAEGGNPNTASTQYYYWKAAQQEKPKEVGVPGDAQAVRLEVDARGRLCLPPDFLSALRLGEDRTVTARVVDGELRASTAKEAIRRARGILAPFKKPGESVVDEFLAERRAMWGEE